MTRSPSLLGVLQVSREDRQALVAVTPYLGAHVPSLDEPALRRVLREYRHRYTGEWAAMWYQGTPLEEHLHLGRVAPSEPEVAYDAKGRFGGHWSAAIANPVVWEQDGDASMGTVDRD